MTAPAPPTEVCVECQRLTVTGHGTFPYAGGHTLALHARIRELVGERDAIKQFAAEEVVRHSATIRERDGLRAALQALDGEGK